MQQFPTRHSEPAQHEHTRANGSQTSFSREMMQVLSRARGDGLVLPWLPSHSKAGQMSFLLILGAFFALLNTSKRATDALHPDNKRVSIFDLPNNCMLGSESYCYLNPTWPTDDFGVDCDWADFEWPSVSVANTDDTWDDPKHPPEVVATTRWCTSGDWFAWTFGPVTTQGGTNVSIISDTLKKGVLPNHAPGVLAVSDYMLGSLDERNSLLGYPPIHQHHFHVYQAPYAGQEAISTHGDSTCQPSEGGVLCNLRRSPPGYAIMIRDAVAFTATINDVRPPGSASLVSSYYIALRPAPAGKPVKQMLLQYIYPIPLSILDQAYDPPLQLSPDTEVVAFDARSFVAGTSEVFDVYAHLHSKGAEQLWLFQGTTEQVFGDDPRFQTPRLLSSPGIVAETKQAIYKRSLEKNAASFACSVDDISVKERVTFDGVTTTYPRRARCKLYSNVKEWVSVFLHTKSAHPPPIHAEFWVYFALNTTKPTALVRPNEDTAITAENYVARKASYDEIDLASGLSFESELGETGYLSV